jgi:DNA-binding PadR family transcriptional regulator
VEDSAPATESVVRRSRFELAPPRRFLLPALLLLLSEAPDYGYNLLKELQALHVGRADRPSVYRALAQLEQDGLVTSRADPSAGHERRVYQLTEVGENRLRVWMGVIKAERDQLDNVLRRYRATGTIDAVLAEIENGWSTDLGSPWSPISPTSPNHAAHLTTSFGTPHPGPVPPARVEGAHAAGDGEVRRFAAVPDRSAVLIEVRSSVGPISFGVIGITGDVSVLLRDGIVQTDVPPSARLDIAVDGLRSGNALYDAELLRRIEARRYPRASVELHDVLHAGRDGRYRVGGDLTFHGITCAIEGTVALAQPSPEMLVLTGEHDFDIRDFDVASPTVLMLRIYPDVRVKLHIEAFLQD